MPANLRQPAFFGDRHTDARMRGLIARFARLGSYLTLATAPLLASGARLGWLVANAMTAFLVTLVAERWRLIERATDLQLQALLVMYGGLIANGTGIAGGRSAPYLLMQALPVLFASVFFPGRARYVIAVLLAAEHALVLRAYGPETPGYAVVVLALCLIVAHFGAAVSDVLREALAANRALHSVLEVTNAEPGSARLPEIGLHAAVSVTGWDAAAVVLRDGDLLSVVATTGLPDTVRAAYAADPMRIDGPGMSADILRTGEPRYVPDVGSFLGPDHVLAREGVACMTGVPIPYHGDNIGVLVVDSRTPRTPDEREWDRLGQVAEQLGLALGNMRAYQREAQVSEELRELNRRKDAFLATVSHELRTPATTITLAARTLRDCEGRLDPDDRAYAHELLVRRSEEMTGMIESLLDEALAESDGLRLQLSSLDWCRDLERWVATARRQTGRDIALTLPDTPVTALADPAKAERIVMNLLSNAAKFSPAGTPIRCALDAGPDALTLTVSDEGPGIPPAQRDRIFDRFYQADAAATREQGGFGIGLSLVRRFAEAHGGTVSVTSAPGAGATFTVRLPRAMVPLGRPPVEQRTASV
ncbi:MAG TPA: ATP-binding protein [Mycobacteriales bacterium]|jgi:signal transduction histidine kinase|nr:ATP-binding protein [Mycobacteriales bacterium]